MSLSSLGNFRIVMCNISYFLGERQSYFTYSSLFSTTFYKCKRFINKLLYQNSLARFHFIYKIFNRITKNHRISGIGRPLGRSFSPIPLMEQEYLDQVTQELIQVDLEDLQRRISHNILGQPVPVFCHPHHEEVSSHIYVEPSVLQLASLLSLAVVPLSNEANVYVYIIIIQAEPV